MAVDRALEPAGAIVAGVHQDDARYAQHERPYDGGPLTELEIPSTVVEELKKIPKDPAQMNHAESWQKAKESYPVGSTARGVVKARFNVGVFLELEEAPAVKGFVDIVSYNPGGSNREAQAPLPGVGETVEGTVVSLVDRDQQIRLQVGPQSWESPSGDG
ncbi:hypothetical protein [Streptomyces sp. NPDC002122]|uniref:hypothetical protein n=1 Tax=Streptomyces sp. NPDC002122 TaxID=3154407 RepID=UPI003332DB77